MPRSHQFEHDIEVENYYDMGCEWAKQREYTKAKECFHHVLSLNPRFIYAYIDLAEIYIKEDNPHEAGRLLQKASKFDPNFHRLYYLMAKYAYINEDYKTALLNIDKALELNPSSEYESMRNVIHTKYQSRRR